MKNYPGPFIKELNPLIEELGKLTNGSVVRRTGSEIEIEIEIEEITQPVLIYIRDVRQIVPTPLVRFITITGDPSKE